MTQQLAVITGASAGIGTALAREMARDGLQLLLVARRKDRLDALVAELPDAHALALDVTSDGAAQAIDAKAAELGKPVDILVNNAGFGRTGRFVEGEPARDLAMIDLNVRALVMLTHHYLPGMIERDRGGVLNVSSVAGFLPGPLLSVYYASKAFVTSFSEALHQELRGTNVAMSALCPGPTLTEFADIADMANTRVFKNSPRMSADAVAKAGWAGFKKNKRLVVPGLQNKASAVATRFVPHAILLPATERMQEKV